ncbi:hypothetical protein PPERSA_04770 [Pseudocohnilembus persalinus]|uniref:Uncharacterized protein n=1 Tax=Pseudocohnilembus persalinus TaxID=266149 RepID=A0A0V0QNY5_PSEPJ|nr:hypothetical protein PPERSA_04770 [Pseudocohnilembus persalinus]|eukprot:KRX03892.1 hypothetical protein PPERSA_04770 [Pseudocohnilembus persalinus]
MEKIKVTEIDIFLDVDLEKQNILGKAKMKIELILQEQKKNPKQNPTSNQQNNLNKEENLQFENQQPQQNEDTLNFNQLQFQILQISQIQQNGLKMKDYSESDIHNKSNFMQKIWQVPNALPIYIQSHKYLIDKSNDISIKFQKDPQFQRYEIPLEENENENTNLNLNRQFSRESNLSENFETLQKLKTINPSCTIEIEYNLKQPISGIKFLNDQGNYYMYTQYFPKSSRYWLPYYEEEILINNLSIQIQPKQLDLDEYQQKINTNEQINYNIPNNYIAVCSGTLQQDIIDKTGKRYFNYKINYKAKTDQIGIVIGEFQYKKCNVENDYNELMEEIDPILAMKNKRNQKQKQEGLTSENLAFLSGNDKFRLIKEKNKQQFTFLFSPWLIEEKVTLTAKKLAILTKNILDYFKNEYINLKLKEQDIFSKVLNDFKIIILPNISTCDINDYFLPQSFMNLCIMDENHVKTDTNLMYTQKNQLNLANYIFKHINFSILTQKLPFGLNYEQDYWVLPGLNEFMADYYRRELYKDKYHGFYQQKEFQKMVDSDFSAYLQKEFQKMLSMIELGQELGPLSSQKKGNSANNNQIQQMQNQIQENDYEDILSIIGTENLGNSAFILKSKIFFHMLSSATNKLGLFTQKVFENLRKSHHSITKLILKTSKEMKDISSLENAFLRQTGAPFLEITYSENKAEKQMTPHIFQYPLQQKFLSFQNETRKELEKFFQVQEESLKQLEANEDESDSEQDMEEEQKKKYVEKKKIFKSKLRVPIMLKSLRFFKEEFSLKVTEFNETNTQDCNIDYVKFELDYNQPESKGKYYETKYAKTQGKKHDKNDKEPVEEVKENKQSYRIHINVEQDREFLFDYKIKRYNDSLLLKQIQKEDRTDNQLKILQNFRKYAESFKKISHPNEKKITQLIEVIQELRKLLENKDKHYGISVQCQIIKSLAHLQSCLEKKYLSVTKFSFQRLIKVLLYSDTNLTLKPNDFSNQEDFYINQSLIKNSILINDEKLGEKQMTQSATLINLLIEILQNNENGENDYDDSEFRVILVKTLMRTTNPKFYKKIENILVDQINQEKLLIEKESPGTILQYALIKLEKFKQFIGTKNDYILHLQKFSQFVQEQHQQFARNLQMSLDIQKNMFLAESLWDQLIKGPSLISPSIRLQWIYIYRTFYFYFLPIPVIKLNKYEEPIKFYFELDETWAKSFKINQDGKNPGSIELKYISFSKKGKRKSFNTLENLLQFISKNQCHNMEGIAKHIINQIMKEKFIEKCLDKEKDNGTIKDRFKDIKFKLRKQKYVNLNQSQQQVQSVISDLKLIFEDISKQQQFKDKVGPEKLNEYYELTDKFFKDAFEAVQQYQEKADSKVSKNQRKYFKQKQDEKRQKQQLDYQEKKKKIKGIEGKNTYIKCNLDRLPRKKHKKNEIMHPILTNKDSQIQLQQSNSIVLQKQGTNFNSQLISAPNLGLEGSSVRSQKSKKEKNSLIFSINLDQFTKNH